MWKGFWWLILQEKREEEDMMRWRFERKPFCERKLKENKLIKADEHF